MRLKNKLLSVPCILKTRLLKTPSPLALRWDITYRCVLRCQYCDLWNLESAELSTKIICGIIDEIAQSGVRKISFSGGEPLLRDDIADIITYTKRQGISPEMNSTGYLFPEKAGGLTGLDLLKLSLDGPEEIHDKIRQKQGSYNWVINAAQSAAKHKIKFIFVTTLTGYNIDYIEDILAIAQRFHTMATFQTIKDIQYPQSVVGLDPLLFPSVEKFKRVISLLIKHKKAQSNLMRNTQRGLYHIYNWPHYSKLRCWAGKIFCMIDPAGNVTPCNRLQYGTKLPNCAEIGFLNALKELPPLPPCDGCGFCGSLELNYLMNFKLDIIPTLFRIMS